MKTPKNAHFHLILDEYAGSVRVWRSSDPGDLFALIPSPLLRTGAWPFCEELAKNFPGQFVLDFPDDDLGETVCELCKGAN